MKNEGREEREFTSTKDAKRRKSAAHVAKVVFTSLSVRVRVGEVLLGELEKEGEETEERVEDAGVDLLGEVLDLVAERVEEREGELLVLESLGGLGLWDEWGRREREGGQYVSVRL